MKKNLLTLSILVLFAANLFSQTWIQKLNGIGMWSMAKDKNGNIYAGTTGTVRAIYKSSNGGESWDTVLSNGVTNFLSITADSSNNVYAANVSNGVMKSTNGGLNWTNIPPATFNNRTVQSVACGKSGYVYVGTTNGGILRSTNNGNTFPDSALQGYTIVTIAFDRYNSNIVYAGASSTSLKGVYRSTDAGLTFSANLNPVTCWGIAQKNANELYCATTLTGYAFTKSTNGGLNWFTSGTQPGAMRGLTLDLIDNIYTSGTGGAFKSTDGGVTFVNAGITYTGNQIISYQNKLFAAISGTANGGVWIFTDSTISGITPEPGAIPSEYSLSQNYPNPFNPETNIRYEIPENSFVKLVVFDALGREVATLVNEKQSPGTYSVDWNASNYSSGVYFYSLSANDFSETKRMLMIK